MPAHRAAGALLLLTALATAISVVARLSADADLPTEIESLYAIGAAKAAYGAGGGARLVAGLALLAASLPLWRVMGAFHPPAMSAAAVLLAASGITSAVSGGCAIALAMLAPESQSTALLLPIEELVGRVEDTLLTLRWAFGTVGFTMAGLALVAMGPVLWRVGGVIRVSAVVGAVLGLAILFIWVDAATVVHRVTGIAFLVWLIVAGLWLAAGRVRPKPRKEAQSRRANKP